MLTTSLPETGPDGRARRAALLELDVDAAAPAGIVEFVSHGRCLIIGPEDESLAFAAGLAGELDCVVAVPGEGAPEGGVMHGVRIVRGGRYSIRGALGDFDARAVSGSADTPLGALVVPPVERFDLVVDLQSLPLLQQAMKPLGYYHPGPEEDARSALAGTLPEMRGEFEKPRYFRYDPEICAHGRSGKRACTRCLESCPAEAIVSVGTRVEVNPYLCQGGGVCATACPTGAMSYAYPRARDLLEAIRGLLLRYREAGGASPCILFYDNDSAAALRDRIALEMPERILPVEIEEIGSAGMETWLSCLAYGADSVVLLTADRTPPQVVDVLQQETATARTILQGMGYEPACLGILNGDQEAESRRVLAELPVLGARRPAGYIAPPDDKRGTLRLALSHLQAGGRVPRRSIALPSGAPFGEVKVSATACTLCMSCVSACPTHALQDGRGLPQLQFREWNCVQCGLCEKTCPESAITLAARFLYDEEAREKPRVLHEEQPVCCVACGKPFATRSMLETLSRKLEGHWMFQDEASRRRLQMCEDCRVRDMFAAEARRPR